MRALVTGAAGFSGSHLCAQVLDQGNTVIAAVRPNGSRSRLQPVVEHFQVAECDLRDRSAVSRLFEQTRPQSVFHLAGLTTGSPEDLYRVNVLGSVNVLSAAAALNPQPRVLLVGSSAQYGSVPEAELPITEATRQCPVTHYGASKLMLETMAWRYVHLNKLHVVMVRPFNLTGPGESGKFVCSEFARQIVEIERKHRSPTIRVGNLVSRRDFTDVRDAVRAYISALAVGEPGDTFNVCSGRTVSIQDVLESLIRISGIDVRVEIDRERMQAADVPAQVGSYQRLKERSGWEPAIPFEQTLRDLLDDWRRRPWEEGRS